MTSIDTSVGLVQRVLPIYRAPFFNALGEACKGGLSVIAGEPRPEEAIETCDQLKNAKLIKTKNVHILHGPAYFCWQRGLTTWLSQFCPQVLIVEANPRYLSTTMSVRWMHQRKQPVIGWGLGSNDHPGAAGRIRRSLRHSFLRQFDALITYSQQGKEQYIDLGIDPEAIVVAPNAVEPRPEKAPEERPPQYENGQPTILFVGRLQERKRLDALMQACAGLPQKVQPRLWIVGEGPAKTALEKKAQEVYPSTKFFGAKFDHELDPIFAASDLFVLPGTGGLAVQQAMTHGLPVVVAEADGTQNDLVRHQNGYLTIPGDVDQLQFTLNIALEDPVKLREMGKESYRIVAEEINLENMVAAFARAIDMVLKR